MKLRSLTGWLSGPALFALCAGTSCDSEVFENSLTPRLASVVEVRDSTALSGQEKRAALAGMGLDPLTINAILRGVRTANQFGGTLRTSFEKVSGDRLSELTPDEVQLYSDAAVDVDGTINYSITDPQADAAVQLFDQYGIESRDALAALLGDPAAPPPNGLPDGFLNDVFVAFDPTRLASVLP